MAQVVDQMPLRREAEVNAVTRPGQPLVQLMLPAAKQVQLAAKAPGRAKVGASSGTKQSK